jgi:hypothetical protein
MLLLGLLSPAFAENPSSTTVDSWKEGSHYYAQGTIDTRAWNSGAWSILQDFARYNQWAPRFLDGNDPDSVHDWVHFKDFVYEPPWTMVVEYDMNRGWPLNKKGNQAAFSITPGDHILNLRLKRGFFGIYGGGLTLQTSLDFGTRFQIDMHLWGLLAALMNDEMFQTFLEEKVEKMALNLVYQAQTLGYTSDL